nr:immunoglobulin light chain junction region [Macaca mulatta]MOX84821.1 immunoglobulin light chain junction region [Macaca mulatta]MOX88118.1 immunoglobulin light chain junction region [Macaca mulatta]MOX88197.1 immunoglobulin light chain junction region [Macaca mulatta]MOX88928.1 immunoglobulin light chain junction region [Macaca mulatta]
CHQTYDTPYSF